MMEIEKKTRIKRNRDFFTSLNLWVKKFYIYWLVKIDAVKAEILMIWTNVVRSLVAWTNIKVTVG